MGGRREDDDGELGGPPGDLLAHPVVPPPVGVVVEATTSVPLTGVVVRWVLDGDDATPVELGIATTGDEGRFRIVPTEEPHGRATWCRLAFDTDLASTVRVGTGPRDEVSVEYVGDAVTIAVAGRAEPSAEEWQALAGFMASNRMTQVWQLASQLTAPPADSPVADWPAGRRAGALDVLGRSLAGEGDDPAALLEQEHYLDLVALADGDTARALNVFRTIDLFERHGGAIEVIDVDWSPFPDWYPVHKSDLELYRDYLRGTWVTAARAMHRHVPLISGGSLEVPSESSLVAQLGTRFHQNFLTSDTSVVPVHQLLLPIIRDVLTSPTARGGLGMTTVPDQGDRSDAEHVGALVALSGLSPTELRNRFRVEFERPEGALASRVELNVETLRGLLSDTWQSPQEPFDTPRRGAERERPLLFPPHLGRAPFHLQFDEWSARQQPFHAENVYEIRDNLPSYPTAFREFISGQKTSSRAAFSPDNDHITTNDDWKASAAWVERMFAIVDTVRSGLAAADRRNHRTALEHLQTARTAVREAQGARRPAWTRDHFVWVDRNGIVNDAGDQRVSLASRATRRPRSTAELRGVERWFAPPSTPVRYSWENVPGPGHDDLVQRTLARARTITVHHLTYLEHVLLPYLEAEVHVARGDIPRALVLLSRLTGYQVGIAESDDPAGYRVSSGLGQQHAPLFYEGASLPYTTAVRIDATSGQHVDSKPAGPVPALPPFELRFLRIAQGELTLALADHLHRRDEPGAAARARELYKGVVFSHGDEPGISPRFVWSPVLLDPFLPGGTFQRNPAVASQLARARLGLARIEQGLNVYGYHRDMVPVLRYAPLRAAAELFAASAKSAQTDFLEHTARFEQAQIDAWQAVALVEAGEAGVAIAEERIEIAKAGVAKAQEQVALVERQVAAKRQEIADADSFFAQAGDFFAGVKDALTNMVPQAQKVADDDSPAEAVSGEQLAGLVTKGFKGGAAAKDAAVATLGSGMGLAIGFGAFAYAGVMSMKSLEAAGNRRAAELKALEEVALPAARAQVELVQREVTIEQLQRSIARTELAYARTLARFQEERFLSVELWNKLSSFANRVMRRYVDLAARSAWLAERALAYEQHRDVRIVKLDYLPAELRGVTGADRLLLDLAELEASRLQGIRSRAPVKHTFSLARDFPVQFGQLKATGYCAVQTDESELRDAYPGMYGFRTRAVTVSAQDADGAPPRGVLRNLGVSTVTDEGGQPNLLVRFPDALPLSEFRLQDDLFVYGLPGETLLQFEGSGLTTTWEIAFPVAANPRGLRSLTDVLLTFDTDASFSPTAVLHAPAGGRPVVRSVMLAASVWDPRGLASLRSATGPIAVRFPMERIALPLQEEDRTIANLVVITVGDTRHDHAASLAAEVPTATTAVFTVEDGIGRSNAGSLLGTATPLPLNAFVGLPLDQTLTLEIERGPQAEELRRVHDVVLLAEYTATV